MYERLTERARQVVQDANRAGLRCNHETTGTGHLLLGLIDDGSGVAGDVMKNLGVDSVRLRIAAEMLVRESQGPRAKKVIEYAMEEARNLNHRYVGTGHLLLGVLREAESSAVLRNLGLNLERTREEVLLVLGAAVATAERIRLNAGGGSPPVGVWRRLGRFFGRLSS